MSKDVWGAVERIKGDRGVFLRAKIIVCSVGEESRSNKARAGKFKYMELMNQIKSQF